MSLQVTVNHRLSEFNLDLTVSLPSDGVTVIWGPSGAGKTHLLRVIAGLIQTQAQVQFRDHVWQDDGSAYLPKPHASRANAPTRR